MGLMVLMFLLGCSGGCQPAHAPVSGDASPVPAGSAVALGAVQAVGSCDAMLSVEVLLGPVVLPVVLRAETRADAAEAECARLRAALESGSDALTHALYLLDANCNQRVSMEAALRRMDAALARDG
jgi:hypothetical protein